MYRLLMLNIYFRELKISLGKKFLVYMIRSKEISIVLVDVFH